MTASFGKAYLLKGFGWSVELGARELMALAECFSGALLITVGDLPMLAGIAMTSDDTDKKRT